MPGKGRVGGATSSTDRKTNCKNATEPALTEKQQEERDKVMERQRKGKAPLRSKITEPARTERARDEGKTTMNARR